MPKINFRDFLLNNGLEDNQYNKIRDEVVASNKRSMTITCIVSIVFFTVMMFLTLTSLVPVPWYIYAIMVAVSTVCLILNHVLIKKGSKGLKYLIYLLVFTLLVCSLLISTVYDSKGQAVLFIGLLILLPILFIDRCYRECLVVFIFTLAFDIIAIFTKDKSILTKDLVNVSIFGIISMITTTYLGAVKVQSFWKGYLINESAIKDALTGIYNRTYYEKNLNRYPIYSKKTITCIYIDANGLHVMNNTLGHEAGDNMLKCVANICKEAIGEEHVYRTGGDEYVGFIIDKEEAIITEIVEKIKSEVDNANYSVSIGYVTMDRKDINMLELIKNSEHAMYEAKSKYYKEKGLEMRNESRS